MQKFSDFTNHYTYRITWSDEDNEFVGLCVEFPSLSWLAETQEEALKGINQLVADVVLDMRDTGEKIPEPLALKKYSGKFQIRTTSDIHRSLVIKAAEAGVSLNRYINAKLA